MTELAIVIPAYKATYLKETLDSIANQTDKRFNLYIGDDCSPYNIESIVMEYKDRIPLIYKRFESNLGGKDLVAQWERCINLTSKEEYIWLFSDDDTMEPRCVESFYKLISTKPSEQLIHFNVNMIDSTDGCKIKTLPKFPQNLTAGEFLQLKLKGKIISFVVEFIFSRKLYEDVNGFQKFDLAWGSDFITWLKMAGISKKGITTIQENDCLVNWRKSLENISPNKSKPILIRKIKALISNASIIQNELAKHSDRYQPCRKSFRWVRFPLGEIFRNRYHLTTHEIRQLCQMYYQEVGYFFKTLLLYIRISIIKK